MSSSPISDTFTAIWQDQALWSELANRLKWRITQARAIALILGILGAFFATLAAQVASEAAGQVQTAPHHSGLASAFTIASTLALAAATLVALRSSPKRVEDWTRARAVSEALKQEAFLYLTQAKPYTQSDRDAVVRSRADAVVANANDLAVEAATITPKPKEVPNVAAPEDYIKYRVLTQIEGYYLPKAKALGKRLKVFRGAAAALTAGAALLSAIAGFSHTEWLGSWVAVATTIAGAIVAHAAAEKYEHNVISYFSTARRLRSLCAQFHDAQNAGTATPEAYGEFVRQCEDAISIENQGWMADALKPVESTPAIAPRAPVSSG
jgi:hypothetical protein